MQQILVSQINVTNQYAIKTLNLPGRIISLNNLLISSHDYNGIFSAFEITLDNQSNEEIELTLAGTYNVKSPQYNLLHLPDNIFNAVIQSDIFAHSNTYALKAFDFNQDGLDDLLITSLNKDIMHLLISEYNGFTHNSSISTGRNPSAIDAQYNGEDIVIAVASIRQHSNIDYFSLDEQNNLIKNKTLWLDKSISDIKLHDMDNNDKLDVVISNVIEKCIQIQYDDNREIRYYTEASPNKLLVSDINNDQKPDIITTLKRSINCNIGSEIAIILQNDIYNFSWHYNDCIKNHNTLFIVQDHYPIINGERTQMSYIVTSDEIFMPMLNGSVYKTIIASSNEYNSLEKAHDLVVLHSNSNALHIITTHASNNMLYVRTVNLSFDMMEYTENEISTTSEYSPIPQHNHRNEMPQHDYYDEISLHDDMIYRDYRNSPEDIIESSGENIEFSHIMPFLSCLTLYYFG